MIEKLGKETSCIYIPSKTVHKITQKKGNRKKFWIKTTIFDAQININQSTNVCLCFPRKT